MIQSKRRKILTKIIIRIIIIFMVLAVFSPFIGYIFTDPTTTTNIQATTGEDISF